MSYPPKFEDIETWQLARELTRKVYSLTKKGKLLSGFFEGCYINLDFFEI